MRDIFEDIFAGQPIDPTEAARRAMRAPQRRRFYERTGTSAAAGGFAVELDRRPVRTPARRPLIAPTQALAAALAAEWEAQKEIIDPSNMPLTRLANSIIDGVVDKPEPVIREIARYLGSDLLFYRVEGPERLVARQAALWDPLIGWARDELGARFMLGEGVVYVEQPDTSLAAARAAIPADPWQIGALSSVTTLTGSALLALALLRGRISVEEAWTAANVDEDWNLELWGRDELALQRRAFRFTEMQAAATVLALSA
jgi:chaperone required for assembly of F1-ATPase